MREKMKTFGIPLGVMVLFVAALFIHQLFLVKELPQPNWSRSLPLDYTSKEKPQVFQNNGDVYVSSKGKVHALSINDQLNVSNENVIGTKITRGYPFWTDGNQFIYYKDGNLVLTRNQEDDVLSEGITGLGTGEDRVYYWSNEKLFEYRIDEGSSQAVHTFQSEISDIHVGPDGSSIVQVKKDDSHDLVYYMNENGEVTDKPFLLVNTSANKKMDGLTFKVKDGQLILLYSEKSRTQGTLSYSVYKVQAPLQELGDSILSGNKMEFVNKSNGEKLESPGGVQFVDVGGKDSVVFTSEGQQVGDNSSVRLYMAPFENGGSLEGTAISTTKHVTYSPLQITDESLVWFNYDGGTYELYGASQNEQVISKSTNWSQRSVREALNNGVLMMFSSLVTIMTSFYWFLPSLFLLILLYIFRPNVFEKDGVSWAEYASIIIFMLMPISYTSKAMNPYFYQVAPEYFVFPGSSYALLVLLGVITWVIWRKGRDPEWGSFAGAFYFMGIYVLFYITSIGPYIFNLF
ncbi:hypothetical protein CN378_08360 [Bacillus sp. AFS015802]|uniref:hypothetical protein n=1 Tax=Bacillus sp. AFS015802 TaxID=2033486 RepID=UPI000BF37132|nr:hypothetical protein [Bacillus sp. AFS015802]PFA68112.1 hypothetical protein CN378_08360 [Bacillus sp. AFS015802]